MYTYDVERWSYALLSWRHHAIRLIYLVLIVLEQNLLARNRISFLPPDFGYPFGTCPHAARDILDVNGVCGVLAGSPANLQVRMRRPKM